MNSSRKHFIGHLQFKRILTLRPQKYILFIREKLRSSDFREAREVGKINMSLLGPEVKFYRNLDTDIIGFVERKEHKTIFKLSHIEYAYSFHARKDTKLYYDLLRISGRNWITFLLINYLLQYQSKFFELHDFTYLKPITYTQAAQFINERKPSFLQFTVHRNHIAWLLASQIQISIQEFMVIPLSFLLPTSRDVARYRVHRVILMEKKINKNGLSDKDIARVIHEKWNESVHSRIVSLCRKQLGIPTLHIRRNKPLFYPLRVEFSNPIILSPQNMKKFPEYPGVYEISILEEFIRYPKGRCPVIYIGSTNKLKKRLFDHLYNLKKYEFTPVVRFVLLKNNWRKVEYYLFHAFIDTYGAKPLFNQITPPMEGGDVKKKCRDHRRFHLKSDK